MAAMWRVGRLIAAPLAVMVVVGMRRSGRVGGARGAGVGWLRTLRRSTPAPSRPRSAALCPVPVDWVRCQTRRRTGAIGGDPGARDRREGRRADGQPGWTRSVGGRHRRRHGQRRWPTPRSAAGSTWSASTRAASGTRRPNCAAAPTPSSTPTGASRWPTTAPPALRTSSRSTASSRSAAWTGWARNSWRTSEPRPRPAISTRCARRSGKTRSTISASPTERNWAPPTPNASATGSGPWCSTAPSTPAWTRSPRPSVKWPASKRLSTLMRPTARSRRAARWAPTRRSSSAATTNWSTRWCSGPAITSDPRGLSYQDAITGTVNALYSQRYWQYLTSGLLGLQRGTDAGDLLLLADDYQQPRRERALRQSAGRVQRHPLCRLRRTRRTRRCGPTPTGGSARRRRS